MMEVVFVQPFEVNAELAQQLEGQVVVLDIAFCADTPRSNFSTTTLPFIQALGDRLALWVDHHEHERHAEFAHDHRFILSSRKEHPAVPEMITPELVKRVGKVDTIVAHGDFDGVMAAAKWILGGEEPYEGADADARFADSRIGDFSEIGQMIDCALKVNPTDDEFRHLVLRYLVSRCQDEEAKKQIEERAKVYEKVMERTNRWAERYVIDEGLAILDIRSEREQVDLTELLLKGQHLAPSKIAVVRNRNLKTGEPQVTIAAPVDSSQNFLTLFGLSGGMPTRVTLPNERYWEVIAKLKGKTNPNPIEPPCFILYADVDRIKEYLFSSVRLRHIVAASGLLSQVNEEETEQLILAHNGRLIFSAGGITQAVFRDENEAKKAGRELQKWYAERTGTASITVTIVPWRKGQNFTDAIEEARREMSRKKSGAESEQEDGVQKEEFWVGRIPFFSGSPFFRVCELTGKEFAIAWEQQPDGTFRSFGATIRQAEKWAETPRHRKSKPSKGEQVDLDPDLGDRLPVDAELRHCLASKLGLEAEKLKFPSDFEELAEDAKPQGYIGFIEADGNRFGEMLKQLREGIKEKTPNEQLAAYEAFSRLLKEATKDALISAVVEVLESAWDGGKIIPLRILLLGGDDVMLVTQAQYALKLTDEFCRRFQEIAGQRKENFEVLKEIPLPAFTMSAGVVIAHHNVPFLSLHRMASELLKSAKKRSWSAKQEFEAGAVDFQVITGSNIEDLKVVRSELYTVYDNGSEISLTGRPYLVSPSEDELSELLGIVEEFKNAGIPRTQLKQLPQIMRLGKKQADVVFARWFIRLGGEGENAMKEVIRKALKTKAEIPSLWQKDDRKGGSRKLYCPLMDVVELFDLFAAGRRER
ncbi:MAG: Cas10/Cmr2 second palm domain-containing protein [Armatimonadota bacterium]